MGAKRGNRSRRTKPTDTAANDAAAAPAGVELPSVEGFTAPDAAGQPELPHEAANEAAEQILGANPLVGIDRAELLDAARRLLRMVALKPRVLLEEHVALARELLSVATGASQIAPDPKDRRFSHEVWQKSGYFKRLMQGFLAWRGAMNRILDRADSSDEDRERARFVLSLFTEAFAPTNSLLGNPGAIQRIAQT
ncbi:MAG: hypothetical protein ACRETX_05560, partial [Steroidobacteraceae bacterium]